MSAKPVTVTITTDDKEYKAKIIKLYDQLREIFPIPIEGVNALLFLALSTLRAGVGYNREQCLNFLAEIYDSMEVIKKREVEVV